MKRTILKTVIVVLLLVMSSSGCKKEEDPGVYVEKQILKFADFGCTNVPWFIKPGYSGTATHYIINSPQDYEMYISSDCNPQIDFSKYIVLIGFRGFATGVSIADEKLEENKAEIVYTVTYLTHLTLVAQGIQYYCVIEIPSEQRKKSIRVVEIIK